MSKIFVPLYDRIVVVPLERELTSEGIYLPESSAEEQKLGVVSFVGPEAKATKQGDLCLFGIYAGIPIELDGRQFIVMRESEVLGVIKEDEASA